MITVNTCDLFAHPSDDFLAEPFLVRLSHPLTPPLHRQKLILFINVIYTIELL
jgi:hypothetical protein